MPTVLITGSNRGIGLGLVREFSALGWSVIATCRNLAKANSLQGLKNVEVLQLDVNDIEAIRHLGKKLVDRPIDLLINNAGVFVDSMESLEDVNEKRWHDCFQTNTMAPYYLTLALLPSLRLGEQRKIVVISSFMGSIADCESGHYYIYRASKAALNAVFHAVSIDLKNENMTVLIIHPGWVKTDMGTDAAPLTVEEAVPQIRNTILAHGLESSGCFLRYDGTTLPW